MTIRPIDYWISGEGLHSITPQGKQWPEGDGFALYLASLMEGCSVLEFGCGPGRLAQLFPADSYFGVDICVGAIVRARKAVPTRAFSVIDEDDPLPLFDVTLAHTVLLHVPDNALAGTVARFTSKRVVVSEILGRHWRRDGNPPVFNREVEDYEAAFAPRYTLTNRFEWPYPHYPNTNLTLLEFTLAS